MKTKHDIQKQVISCPLPDGTTSSFEVSVIPKGTEVYRIGNIHKDRQEWFRITHIEPSKKKLNLANTHVFHTNQELVMLNLHGKNIRHFYKVIEDNLTLKEKEVWSTFVPYKITKSQKKHIKALQKVGKKKITFLRFVGFLPDDNVNYISLRFAKILCRYGIDGWITEKSTILEKPSYVYLPPEILVCPSSFAKLTLAKSTSKSYGGIFT